MRVLFAFFVRDAKLAASYRLELFVQMTGVITLSFTFFFLSLMLEGVEGRIGALQRYGGSYFGFALVGLAFSGYLDASLRGFAQGLRQAQMTGTLEAMLATRAPLAAVVAGSAIYSLAFTTLRVGVFMGVGFGLFELPWEGAQWGWAALVLVLTVCVTLVLGVVAAGFVVRFKHGDPITAGLAGLSWLLSGVIYPKEILPPEVQAVAWFLPMTHSLEAMRLALLTGAGVERLSGSLLYLGAFTLAGLPLALVWFRRCVRAAKRAGTLAHY